jgi:hypothetical protein
MICESTSVEAARQEAHLLANGGQTSAVTAAYATVEERQRVVQGQGLSLTIICSK